MIKSANGFPYRLVVLRHGQSEWNAAGVFTGWENARLTAEGELEAARYYSGVSDILMLDTFGDPPSELLRGFIGGTGRTSDWSLARSIVEGVNVPVILAGGLNLANVGSAIESVKPWGVDAASALSITGSGGRKDMEKVRRFVAIAKGL